MSCLRLRQPLDPAVRDVFVQLKTYLSEKPRYWHEWLQRLSREEFNTKLVPYMIEYRYLKGLWPDDLKSIRTPYLEWMYAHWNGYFPWADVNYLPSFPTPLTRKSFDIMYRRQQISIPDNVTYPCCWLTLVKPVRASVYCLQCTTKHKPSRLMLWKKKSPTVQLKVLLTKYLIKDLVAIVGRYLVKKPVVIDGIQH